MSDNAMEVSAALTEMDDDLVSEAANAGMKKSGLKWLIPAAAALVLAAGAAIVLPRLIAPKDEEIEASLPEPTEIAEAAEEPAPTEANGYADAAATFDPAQATVEPMETAPAYAEPQVFDSVVTLSAAVNSGELSGLGMIYMPTRVIYGAELESITVEADKVTVTYGIDKDCVVEEEDPNRFVLIWFREWQPGTAEEYARYLSDNGWGFFFHEIFGTWSFQSNLENIAVWEENGYGFELIMPAYYGEDEEVLRYKDLTLVPLDEASAHDPFVGLEDGGYLQLKENGFTYAPRTSFAYGTTYCVPEAVLGGADGRMLHAEGMDFIESIPEEQREFDPLMRYFPQVGYKFEPALAENVRIVRIDVYHPITLEPIELDITLDELHDIAEGKVSPDMEDLIFGDCRGCVLVDTVIEHRGAFIEELGEYETDAYHCGFIIDCGY